MLPPYLSPRMDRWYNIVRVGDTATLCPARPDQKGRHPLLSAERLQALGACPMKLLETRGRYHEISTFMNLERSHKSKV